MLWYGCSFDKRDFFHEISIAEPNQRVGKVSLDFTDFRVDAVTHTVVDSESGVNEGIVNGEEILNIVPVWDSVFQDGKRH